METKQLFTEVYMAYFDCLGFKEFIEKNEDETLVQGMDNIFRDIEHSMGQGPMRISKGVDLIADLSKTQINCLNISDTIVYWTNDLNKESLTELMDVAYKFNMQMICNNFPIRGTVIKGKIKLVSYNSKNINGGLYNVSCLYGKGIVSAHNKAEFQDWAGTVIDESVREDLSHMEGGTELLEDKCTIYQVPYKEGKFSEIGPEYVFQLIQGKINTRHFENKSNHIKNSFKRWNKSIDSPSIQLKIQNTIDYLKLSLDKDLPIIG